MDKQSRTESALLTADSAQSPQTIATPQKVQSPVFIAERQQPKDLRADECKAERHPGVTRRHRELPLPIPLPTALPTGLNTLAKMSAQGRIASDWKVRRPLTLDELEMLEAELDNQGVLEPVESEGVYSVSQRAAFEIASLRWRARRVSPERKFEFVVDIPRYLVHWAKELLAEQASPGRSTGRNSRELKPLLVRFRELVAVTDPQSINDQLNYLERFAAYILGTGDCNRIRARDRGLEVVLKVLGDPSGQGVKENSLRQQSVMQHSTTIDGEALGVGRASTSAHSQAVMLTVVLPIVDGGKWLGF